MKTQIVHKHNIKYDIISVDMLFFEIQGIGWDHSMTRISYKLTKRTKTEKSLNIYNIIIFQTIGYKLTVSGNKIHIIVNYNFMRPVRILRLPKNKKNKVKNSKLKKINREKGQRHQRMNFSV